MMRKTMLQGTRRLYTTATSLHLTKECPAPTCACREMPALDIELKQNLNNTIPAYAEQILISTGQSDWTSKIEEDTKGEFARLLKSYIGPKGKYANPFHNVMLTHSSFPSSSASTASAYLLPSFHYVPAIPLDTTTIDHFVKAFVLPTHINRSTAESTPIRQPDLQQGFPKARDVKEILILICSHTSRDSRCGILAPILKAEFQDKLRQAGIRLLDDEARDSDNLGARIGMISHVGGHRWAGNVIIYTPPSYSTALAGSGIWYGRVQPEHVEGIVSETLLRGNVIQELFRGGIRQDGSMIRI